MPLFILVLTTLMIPYHVILIPQYLIFRDLGWLNTLKPLIVPAWFGGGAFFIFLLRQFFMTIPREYDDAARIDGCGFIQVWWHIILPMSLPALGAVAIFTFMGEWNDFLAPLIYLNTPENRHWRSQSNSGGARRFTPVTTTSGITSWRSQRSSQFLHCLSSFRAAPLHSRGGYLGHQGLTAVRSHPLS